MPAEAVSSGGALAPSFRFLAVLAISLTQYGCWEGTTRETLATILSIEGKASYSTDGGRTFVALDATRHPGKGDILQTDSNSQLSFALLPNCLLQLHPESSAQIVRISLTKDGNETGSDVLARLAEIKLQSGRLLVSHVWGEARASLTVATNNGHVSTPSNALFWVDCAEGKTRVTCATGWVEFRPSDAADSTRIPPGSIGQWPAANANVTAAETDPRGQDDLLKATEIEKKLRDLASRTRNILPR